MGCGGLPPDNEEAEELGVAESELSAGCAVLKSKNDPVLWSGTVGPEDGPVGGEPPECREVNCDHFRLRLNVPRGTFQNPNRPGGLEIGIRWPNANNTLNLFVYKGNTLVAKSAGIIATAQAVFVPEPSNGDYVIWIAADPTYNLDPSVPYDAFAEIEFKPKTTPLRQVLPDLQFRAPRNARFATPSMPIFEPDPPPGSTCFTTESVEDGARLCLRFDQVIANVGEGPLEVREAIPKDPSNTALNAFQRIYSTDGSFVQRPAGDFEFHEEHQHYHYKSFAVSALWASDSTGKKLGTTPVRSTRKVSFCIADIEMNRFGQPGIGPRTYFAPDCLFPQASDDNFDYLIVGMTNGWTDVYDWFLPGQYVEVTGVSDGFYLLESCADPDSKLVETAENNNCIDTLIRLSNMTAPMPNVETLRTLP